MFIVASTGAGTGGTPTIIMFGYIILLVGFMYFVMIRPQKKQEKKIKSLLASMEVGDIVLTSSGFYGEVIDITDDTVIVEFGNNRNCRIPMKKAAIVEVEKPNAE